MLLVAFITVIAIAGAVAGVLTSASASFRQLVPFSSGLLFGMALFLILPEAFQAGERMLVAGFCILGCFLFGLMETALHSVHPSPVRTSIGLLPLVTAVGLHSLLDGWNIAFAMHFTDRGLMIAFMIGMSLHKLAGGIALGAIFRAAEPQRDRAIAWAAGCELMTVVGAFLNTSISQQVSGHSMTLLLAATGGSFLYLGYHSIQVARRRCGLRPTVAVAALGFASIGLISLLHR